MKCNVQGGPGDPVWAEGKEGASAGGIAFAWSYHKSRTQGVRTVSRTICYCFNFTEDDIRNDITRNGSSTILAYIVEQKKKTACQCPTKNPKKQ